MNRRSWMFGLMGGLVLMLSLASTPAWAQAERQRQCDTEDLTGMVIGNEDCPTLLPVTLTSGTQTTCINALANDGGQANGVGHVVGQGIGVDTNGNQYLYRVNITTGIHIHIGETTAVTVAASALLIGQGSAPNEVVDLVMHAIVDADGNLLSVIIDKVSARCQG